MRRIVTLVVSVIVVAVSAAQLELLASWGERLPAPFQHSFLKVAAWQWGGLVVLWVISLLCGLVVRSLIVRLTLLRDRYAPQPMSDATRIGIGRAGGILGGSLLALALVSDFELRPGFERDLMLMIKAIALFGGILMLYGWWDATCDTIAARAAGIERAERLLVPMTRKLVRALIVGSGLLLALGLFGGTQAITSLLATLGIGGIVIALAAKDSIENLFGSLTILFDMPFALGDWVKIDKVEGAVEEINLRSTRVRTAEDTVITLPNANLIRASVENYGPRRFRRQRLFLRLRYGSGSRSIEAFCQSLLDWLRSQPYVQKDQSVVELNDPQDASIGVLVQCFFDVMGFDEEMHRRHEMLLEAVRLSAVHGVPFATEIAVNPNQESPGAHKPSRL